MELNIYHLYPGDVHGDRGNVLCMQRRLEWRGMQANVFPVPIGTKFIEGLRPESTAAGKQGDSDDDLKGEKTAELKAAIEARIPRSLSAADIRRGETIKHGTANSVTLPARLIFTPVAAHDRQLYVHL